MGQADYLKLGSYNAVCYFCGFKFKADQLRRYWQGFYTCERCWEPRQPQDFARNVIDVQTPPWSQPMPEWVFGLDEIILEGTETDFVAPNPIVTETTFQPFFLEN